jgi:hypothetical protein
MIGELALIKQELIAVSASTNLGFQDTADTKQQIETLAAKIELLNPTTEPTKHLDLVQGSWQLLYSTFGLERETTLQRLSFGKFPNVRISVTGIFQEIYLEDQKYNNLIEFTVGDAVRGIVIVAGRYTIENHQRLNIDFWETSVKSVSNDLDELAFREILGINHNLPLVATLAFNGWSDITYLDDNLRLMRGNQQNLYVLVRKN